MFPRFCNCWVIPFHLFYLFASHQLSTWSQNNQQWVKYPSGYSSNGRFRTKTFGVASHALYTLRLVSSTTPLETFQSSTDSFSKWSLAFLTFISADLLWKKAVVQTERRRSFPDCTICSFCSLGALTTLASWMPPNSVVFRTLVIQRICKREKKVIRLCWPPAWLPQEARWPVFDRMDSDPGRAILKFVEYCFIHSFIGFLSVIQEGKQGCQDLPVFGFPWGYYPKPGNVYNTYI